MPRHRARDCAIAGIACAVTVALAAAVAGCSRGTAILDDLKEVEFKKPTFSTPDWGLLHKTKTAELAPHGPVPPEQLVDAAGRCGVAAQPAEAPPAPEEAPAQLAEQPSAPDPATTRAGAQVGSIAGDLASAPMPQGPPPAPRAVKPAKPRRVASANPRDLGGLQPEGTGSTGAPIMGGIALGMTECQAVRRAGQPNHVTIGVGGKGARKVVLTYLSGPWPGVYTFQSGRLKVIDGVPAKGKPAKPPRKTPRRPARTAAGERVYVR